MPLEKGGRGKPKTHRAWVIMDSVCRGNAAGPYEDLYIYLIRGPVTEEDETAFGKNYLGNWVEDDSSFLFFSGPSPGVVQRLLNKRSNLAFLEEYHFSYEEWQGGGLDRLRVYPFAILQPWETEVEVPEDEIRLLLDPGVVFGTGLHPTTQDCIRALVFLREQVEIGQVLDLGTGTGILAIAAALLGAEGVLALDLNPLCVKTAQHNVELNQLKEVIQVSRGKAEDFPNGSYDLVIANIHHQVMADLFDVEGFQDSKWFILSGLMRTQAGDIRTRMKKCGITLIREWDHEMTWYTMLGHNDK